MAHEPAPLLAALRPALSSIRQANNASYVAEQHTHKSLPPAVGNHLPPLLGKENQDRPGMSRLAPLDKGSSALQRTSLAQQIAPKKPVAPRRSRYMFTTPSLGM